MSRHLTIGLMIWLAAEGVGRAQEPEVLASAPQEVAAAPVIDAAPDTGFSLRRELYGEFLTGFYKTSKLGPDIHREFDYIPIVLRVGSRPFAGREGYLREHFSLLVEGMLAPITRDFGHIMGGPSLIFRLDILDPNRTIVPYVQFGTGFLFNDAYVDQNQRAIGECFEFLQQAELGVRWKLNDNLSVLVEGGWQHVSNGGLAPRNLGVNNLGGSIGVHWSFGAGR